MRKSDLEVLKLPNLRRFFISRSVTVLGGSIAPIATAFAILDLPGATSQTLAVVEICIVVAQCVGILVGGLIADRWSRVKTLVLGGSTAAIGMGFLGTMFLLQVNQILIYCAGSLLVGIGSGLGFPVFTAIIADIVPVVQLQSANGLFRMTRNLSRVAGAGIAGVLVVSFGSAGSLIAIGVGFALSAIIVAGIQSDQQPRLAQSMVKDIKEGWSEFISFRWIVIIVGSSAILNSMYAGMIDVIGPVVAKSELGGPKPWAFILMCSSIGAIVGTFIALRLKYRRPLLIATSISFAIPLSIYLLAAPAPVWALALSAALVGISMDVFGVAWDGALQREVPREALGRISSYDWFGSMIATPLGIALAGWGAERFTPGAMLQWMALIGALALCWPLFSRSVREVR